VVTTPISYRTKTDLAVEVVRSQILSGDLGPGERIRPSELATTLGMSPTPVREALRVLQADGLVRYRTHQEIVVAERTPEEALEVYRLRCLLEPLAVEQAAERLTDATLRLLERVHHRLEAAVHSSRRRSTGTINAAWHWTLYEAADSPLLLSFVRRLWEAFPWRTMWVIPGRAETSVEEHAQIMLALRAREPRRAASLMRQHIESGRDTLLERLWRERSDHLE
jgi:DNA-binding GntR family transcriptional regulator